MKFGTALSADETIHIGKDVIRHVLINGKTVTTSGKFGITVMHSEKAVFKIGGLNLLPSDYCPRGKFYILGGPVKKPENWASMTDNEKIRWAAKYSAKVIYNPLDKIPEIPAPIEP